MHRHIRYQGCQVCGGKQQDFKALKQAVSQPPVLRMAHFCKKFILQMNASGLGPGAALSQEFDGVRLPIAYASRTLSAP
jgi:predicted ATP-grasp superfamily ATP-dependent carboligase